LRNKIAKNLFLFLFTNQHNMVCSMGFEGQDLFLLQNQNLLVLKLRFHQLMLIADFQVSSLFKDKTALENLAKLIYLITSMCNIHIV
jgi:hypothetical protein